MKHLILLCFFICLVPLCKAQEEIIFNNLHVDKHEIKVAKVIQGFEFSTDFIRVLPGRYEGYLFGSVETHFRYFHENRIANTWTLNKSVGLGNAFYRIYEYHCDGTPWGYIQGDDVYQYTLSLDLKIEPRWYFDQRLRYRHNKKTRNNSGWFLSVPLTLSTNPYQQPVEGSPSQWLTEGLYINITAPLTIGYRNSFAKNWFLEVNAGYIPLRAWYYDGLFITKSARKIGAFSADSFNSELKIAYTL